MRPCLILLAMQTAGSTDSGEFKGPRDGGAAASGEQIFPAELEKVLRILAGRQRNRYVGASAVELVGSERERRQLPANGGRGRRVRYRPFPLIAFIMWRSRSSRAAPPGRPVRYRRSGARRWMSECRRSVRAKIREP